MEVGGNGGNGIFGGIIIMGKPVGGGGNRVGGIGGGGGIDDVDGKGVGFGTPPVLAIMYDGVGIRKPWDFESINNIE